MIKCCWNLENSQTGVCFGLAVWAIWPTVKLRENGIGLGHLMVYVYLNGMGLGALAHCHVLQMGPTKAHFGWTKIPKWTDPTPNRTKLQHRSGSVREIFTLNRIGFQELIPSRPNLTQPEITPRNCLELGVQDASIYIIINIIMIDITLYPPKPLRSLVPRPVGYQLPAC